MRRMLEAFCLRRARLVIAVSDATAESARRLGVAPEKLRVVRNGIDPEVRPPWTLAWQTAASQATASQTAASQITASQTAASQTTASQTMASQTMACQTMASQTMASQREETQLIVGVGRLDRSKGWDVFIDALPEVIRRCPPAHAVLVGGGPQEQRLRRQARGLGLAVRVAFLGPAWDPAADHAVSQAPGGVTRSAQNTTVSPAQDGHERLAVGPGSTTSPSPESWSRTSSRCNAAAELPIVVIPSREEGFGMVLLEAMAAGHAIVASRTGGIAEIARHGVEALLVEPENPGALADAICRLLEDASLRRSLAQRAEDRARAFPLARMKAGYEQAWFAALEADGTRSQTPHGVAPLARGGDGARRSPGTQSHGGWV